MKAYWIGKSIVAAPDVPNALLVMARHDTLEKWIEDEVQELTTDELSRLVDDREDYTVADALRAVEEKPIPSSLDAGKHGRGALIRWGKTFP